MFSSEQKLSINGSKEAELLNALKFSLNLAGRKTPAGWLTRGDSFILYWGKPGSVLPGYHRLDESLSTDTLSSMTLSTDTLSSMIWDFIQFEPCRKERHTNDGTTKQGWEIAISKNRYDTEEYLYPLYQLFTINRDWIYYYK